MPKYQIPVGEARERLRAYINANYESQQAFADRVGVCRSVVSQALNNPERGIPQSLLDHIGVKKCKQTVYTLELP